MSNAKQFVEKGAPSLWQVLGSTVMSYLGISTPARRQRDFEQGDARIFVVMGLLVALAFIALVMAAVTFALSK